MKKRNGIFWFETGSGFGTVGDTFSQEFRWTTPPSPAGNFERQATCRPPKPLTSWHSVTIVPPMNSNLGSHALTSSRGLMSRVRSPLSNGLLVVCLNCSWNKSDWLLIFNDRSIYAQKRQKWNIIIKCTVRCYKLLCLGKKRKNVVQKENKKLTESQSGCNSLVLDSNKFTHHSIYLLSHFRKIKNLISFLALCHYRFNVFVT